MHRFAPAVYLLCGAVIGGLLVACTAGANQPNMQAALSSLQAAKAELIQARPNKGGHRERAMDLIQQAVVQVQQGIDFASRG